MNICNMGEGSWNSNRELAKTWSGTGRTSTVTSVQVLQSSLSTQWAANQSTGSTGYYMQKHRPRWAYINLQSAFILGGLAGCSKQLGDIPSKRCVQVGETAFSGEGSCVLTTTLYWLRTGCRRGICIAVHRLGFFNITSEGCLETYRCILILWKCLLVWFICCMAGVEPECIIQWLPINYMSLIKQ